MKYGVRNDLQGVVKNVKKGEIMAQAEFVIEGPVTVTAVITRESMDDLNLKPGDKAKLLIKGINVIPAVE